MGFVAKALRTVRYGMAKSTAPIEHVSVLRLEFNDVAYPTIGEFSTGDVQLERVPSGELRLLEPDRQPERLHLPAWTLRSQKIALPELQRPRNAEVGLPPTPKIKGCLGWPVKPTGRIAYSEFRFFRAAVQSRLSVISTPGIHESELAIWVADSNGGRISELEVCSPTAPRLSEYVFKLTDPRVVDCSEVLGQLTRVSDNLFRPLGKARSAGKNYRSSHLRRGRLGFDQRTEGEGYKKSYTERRNESGGISRQGMTVWDLLFPLLQAPPFDLKSQQQVLLPAELLPHQPEGVHFLASREAALLGDGVQTGKTIQTVVAMKLLFQTGRIQSALIVCPIPLLIHWQRELEKWAPELWQGLTVVRSTNKGQRQIMWRMSAHVYAINYETMVSDLADILSNHREKGFGLVVADEIQRIKNPGTEVAKALKEIGKLAKYRWGLSATPLENKVEDVVSIFEFLKPGLLRRNFESEQSVQQKINSRYFLRRRTADVAKHFKEPRHDNYHVEMEGDQLDAYEAAFRESVAELRRMGERVTLTHALAKLQALKQLCNVHLTSGVSAKADWLEDTLEEITSSGDKALVFSQYVDCGRDFLEGRLKRFGCVNYGKATTDNQRRALIDAFAKDTTKKVFLANPRTAGVGMPDLKEANYVIHFDHWWNPAIIDQANGRILGYGQKKEAFIVHLWVENSIEGRIQAILGRKRGLFDRVIDSQTSVGGTGLSEEELFEVFGLTPPPRRPSPQAPPATPRAAPRKRADEWTQSDMRALSPTDFENLAAKLYKSMGFAAQLTQQTRDEGVDVIAIRDIALGRDKLAVQCKHQSKPVGRPELQKLLGVVTSDSSFSAGVLITTSTFSSDARRFAERNARLRLIDGIALLMLLNEHCRRGPS